MSNRKRYCSPIAGRGFGTTKYRSDRSDWAGKVLVTNLAERLGWEEWEKSRCAGMVGRAQLKAVQLLRDHQLKPLAPGQDAEPDDIRYEAERKIYEELNPSH